VNNETHLQPQKAVHLAHPLTVTLSQVVVDSDDMHTPACQSVQIGGKGGHQGFALAGFHLGNPALVQYHATHQLDPVRAHAQHPVGGFPYGGKGFWQDVV